jgi:hypothetical protein
MPRPPLLALPGRETVGRRLPAGAESDEAAEYRLPDTALAPKPPPLAMGPRVCPADSCGGTGTRSKPSPKGTDMEEGSELTTPVLVGSMLLASR